MFKTPLLETKNYIKNSLSKLSYDSYSSLLSDIINNLEVRQSNRGMSDYDIKTEYKYYSEALDNMVELLYPYTQGKVPNPDLFALEKSIDIEKEFDTDTWLTLFKKDLKEELSRNKDINKVLEKNVIDNIDLDANIIGEKIKNILINSLKSILDKITSINVKKEISKSLETKSTPRLNKLVDFILSDIKITMTDMAKYNGFIDNISEQLSKSLKIGVDKERDIENVNRRYSERKNNIDLSNIDLYSEEFKKALAEDKDLNSIMSSILESFKKLQKFTTIDLSENDSFGDSYKSAMLLIDSIKDKKLKTLEDIIDLEETFKKESVNSRTFETYNKAISKYLDSKKEEDKITEKKAVLDFPKDLNNKSSIESMKKLEEKYNNPKIIMDYKDTAICISFIIAFDILIDISNSLEKAVIMIPKVVHTNLDDNFNTEAKETLSIYTYKRFFTVNIDNGNFVIEDRKDDKIEEDIDYITKEFDRILYITPYSFCIDRLESIHEYFASLRDKVKDTDNSIFEDKTAEQVFKEAGISPERGERLIDLFLDSINDSTKDAVINSKIMKYINKNAYIKSALGLSGKFMLNFGKMAVYFLKNGGFATFKKGMELLNTYPSEFLKSKLATSDECRRIYERIRSDSALYKAYKNLQSMITRDKDIIEELIQKTNSEKTKNKRIFRDFFEDYNILLSEFEIAKVIQRITKGNIPIGFGLSNVSVINMIKFITDISTNKNLSDQEIAKKCSEEKGKNYNSKAFSAVFTKIVHMFTIGSATAASSYSYRNRAKKRKL